MRWAADLPATVLAARCIRPAQQYITTLIQQQGLGPVHNQVLTAGRMLEVLYLANERAGGKVPYTEFYNKASGCAPARRKRCHTSCLRLHLS